MQLLQDAGIYLIADLSQPSQSIDRSDPVWDVDLYNRYTSVVDALANYTNVIGFFAGNEVSNNASNTDASAFVKAAVRDMKAYISDKGYRSSLGVGYATNDDADIRVNLADYFDCGSDDERIDFWGYNIYSWCGNSSYEESGYADRTEEFKSYNVPAFFAEYGCNTVEPRVFTEVAALFGDEMTDVWSGGIVYMYFQETNDYGLVTVIDSTSVSKLTDFTYYSKEINAVSPSLTASANYSPTNTANQDCPAVGTDWAAASALPPTPNENLCDCMTASLSCQAKSSLSDEGISDLFSYVCGLSETACEGILANGTAGSYGAYSMCEAIDKLSWAINEYYVEQDKASDACSFGGSATTHKATSATGTCATLMSQAGTAGTGTVTSEPSAASGSSGSSSTGSSSSGAAGALGASQMTVAGSFQIGAYIVGAFVAGAGMIIL